MDDFVIPEFRGKNPDDYEFREDGVIVRKDRWERGIRQIKCILCDAGLLPNEREFEIQDIVNAVRLLVPKSKDDE